MRVNFVLAADRSIATARYHGWMVAAYLERHGVTARMLATPPFPYGETPWPPALHADVARLCAGEVVVLQKQRGANAEALAAALREASARTVAVYGDWDPDNDLAFRTDALVCSARWLADHYAERGVDRVVAIPDPAEFWADRDAIDGGPREPGPVRLVWMGHRGNWETLEPLRELLRDRELADFRLVTVSNHADANVRWSPAAVRELVAQSHIGVVPTRPPPVSTAKSNNRVIQFMAAGKPFVAGRIPSYEEVVRQGWNGFLCDTPDEWRAALLELRDPERRAEVGRRGFDTVFPRYHADTIGAEWLAFFESLGAREGNGLAAAEEARLLARVRGAAQIAYAREALARNLGLREVLRIAAPAAAYAPLVPGGTEFLRDLAPSLRGRAREKLARTFGFGP
jgi:hypothetical protein